MMIIRRCICYGILMMCINAVLLLHYIPSMVATVTTGILLSAFYLYFHIVAVGDNAPLERLRILNGGYELVLAAVVCLTLELIVYLCLIASGAEIPMHLLIINGGVGVMLLSILLLNGVLRILLCSKQVGMVPKLALLLLWWVPLLNIIMLKKLLQTSHREYIFTQETHNRDMERKQNKLCETTYPLLMVHGIFFRDWEKFNYWGRVPKALTNNGAIIYYGNHQSSASVEHCAEELRQCITDILQKTGCQKVNIIAHSKGGLDARYAISCLGMGAAVASLTTVNTPHLGCNYVGKLLDKISDKTVASIGKQYESLYTKLGDESPDFFSGLKILTDKECSRLNNLMQDDPRVLYQSVGSRMHSHRSAMFPLNIGYSIIKFFGGGQNDGLVSTQSMVWGNFLGVLSSKGKQGISHGDMIDLTRKDIEGFDVCEFYVNIVHKLKMQGL